MKTSGLVLVSCAALIMSSACGGGGGGAVGGGGGADLQALLQGTWNGDCMVIGSASTRSAAVFTGLDMATSFDSWPTNTTCTGTPASFGPYHSTYVLGAAVTAALGAASVTAYQIDITDKGGTVHDLVYVDQVSTPQRIYLGDGAGGHDGSTAALRPIALDATISWHR